MSDTTHRIITGVLLDWLRNESFPDRNLGRLKENRARSTEIIYGTVKQYRLLEFILSQLAGTLPPLQIRASLLAALYELLFMDSSEHAVVNKTVDQVKADGGKRAAGFANAVLRRASREREELFELISQQDAALRLSHPEEAFERWSQQTSPEDAETFCEWNNARSRVTIRFRSEEGRDAVLAETAAQGMDLRPHPFRPGECFVLPRGLAVHQLPGFKKGLFAVQDPSTLISIDLLNPQEGQFVLDACASPGGKTGLLSEGVGETGTVIAADLHEDRLLRLNQNCVRLSLSNVEVVLANATKPAMLRTVLQGRTPDAILADVPCSNTGVLQRRPDARWRLDADRLAELEKTQLAILDGLSEILAPGGILIYSTCSIEKRENEDLVRAWLQNHSDFSLASEQSVKPWIDHVDGAYAARLVKS
jgi:16S rRNA (cytosine967-C5)-methyltransferase